MCKCANAQMRLCVYALGPIQLRHNLLYMFLVSICTLVCLHIYTLHELTYVYLGGRIAST